MAEIFHLFNIKTEDAGKVFSAITEQGGLASWWTTETEVQDNILKFTFTKDYYKKMKVVKSEAHKYVEWECIHADDQWLATRMSFDIITKEGSVDVRFRHFGWKEQTDLFGICNYHWGLYMKSLKTYIETGTGNPTKPNLS